VLLFGEAASAIREGEVLAIADDTCPQTEEGTMVIAEASPFHHPGRPIVSLRSPPALPQDENEDEEEEEKKEEEPEDHEEDEEEEEEAKTTQHSSARYTHRSRSNVDIRY